MTTCGLDFGTSNSAIGVVRDSIPTLVPVENTQTLIPTALFFDLETRGRVLFGNAAISAYVEQHDGRLMRAIKSILGSPLVNERTIVGGRAISFLDVIEIFIRHLKARAEDFADREITSVVHGRPVRFIDDDDFADARAETLLESIAKKVGFRDIAFVYEPIAAAFRYESLLTKEETVLVADIGGGTSDFTVIRVGPQRREKLDRKDDILANAGARIGGTDFDAKLSLNKVMPLLGLGTHLRTKGLPVPNSVFFELANWATINFAYGQQNEREVSALVEDAVEHEKLVRLQKIIKRRLGHRLALTVESAKIVLSSNAQVSLDLSFLEDGLLLNATQADFADTLEESTSRLQRLAAHCIHDAGLGSKGVDTIFFTGGSSRIPIVRESVQRAAPWAAPRSGEDMTSVALGLTINGKRRFG
jgi:hypothetical chaperone protein